MADAGGSLSVYCCKSDEQDGTFVADVSPFVHKLLAYLELTSTPFEYVPMASKSRPKPPLGKLPFVKLPSGELLSDSQLIVDELERSKGPARLDAWLSPEQLAKSHLIRRTLEESVYWNAFIEKRWRRKSNFTTVTLPRYFSGVVPGCLWPCLGPMIRKRVVATYVGQGMGKHSESEATSLAVDDLRAIEELMGSGPFLHGAKPSTVDAVIYAWVAGIKYQEALYAREADDKEVNSAAFPKLVAHFDHMERLLRVGLAAKTSQKEG